MVQDINFQDNRNKGEKETKFHLTLLAKNDEGLKDLFKLTTLAHVEGFYYKPRVDIEMVDNHKENLIVLSGCMSGALGELLIEGRHEDALAQAKAFDDRFDDYNRSKYDIQVETAGKITANLSEYKQSEYDLLIVDEVHHYTNKGGESWGEVANLNYERVLGLSAEISVEQRKRLRELLGPVIFEYSQDEAIDDGIVPELRWLLHEVRLTPDEQEEYKRKRNRISYLLNDIRNDQDLLKTAHDNAISLQKFDLRTFFEIWESSDFAESEAPESWRDILKATFDLRRLVYNSQRAKRETIVLARKYAEEGLDVIVFTMDQEYAEEIGDEIDSALVIHSDIDGKEDILDEFERKEDTKVLVGVKMLDEGVDVPEVDVAINAAAEKTRRQLIQRQGRILRRGGEHKPVFHQFVIEDEADHYSNIGSVEPEFREPETVIERNLPVTVGTVDVWDIYNSLSSEELRKRRDSDAYESAGMGWWLRIYEDVCGDLFDRKIKSDL